MLAPHVHVHEGAAGVVAFTVPVPPSSNNLFVNVRGRGRVRSQTYSVWAQEAGLLLNRQKPGCVDGPFEVLVRLPAKTRGDIDNRYKAIGDLMTEHGVTPDDRHLQRLVIERVAGISDAEVTVSGVAP